MHLKTKTVVMIPPSNIKRQIKRKRRVLDAKDTSIEEITQHAFVNMLFGFVSGIVIAFVTLFVKDSSYINAVKLAVTYLILKQVESKVLNRNKYTSKFGKKYLYPFPSMIGFVGGVYISLFI